MERLAGEVRGELARFGPAAGMAEIVAAWTQAVGEAIARNAWPARLARDGTLHVATSSSLWAFELSQLAPALAERLRERLGTAAPRGLRFAPGQLPEPAPTAEERAGPSAPMPGMQERARAVTLVANIDDAELRSLAERAVAASLARDASDRGF